MRKKNFYAGVLLTSAMFMLGNTGAVYAADNASDNASATGYPEYDEILSKYYEGVSAGWDMQQLQENNLNYLFYYEPDINTLGYCLRDIDNDGTEELFIGKTDDQDYYEGMVYDMYTMLDGKVVQFLTSGERDRYFLCKDNTIAEEGSGSAWYSLWSYYNYKNGKLEKIETVFTDGQYDPQNPWFYTTSDSGDDYSTPLTEENAQSIINSYEHVTDLYSPVTDLNLG